MKYIEEVCGREMSRDAVRVSQREGDVLLEQTHKPPARKLAKKK